MAGCAASVAAQRIARTRPSAQEQPCGATTGRARPTDAGARPPSGPSSRPPVPLYPRPSWSDRGTAPRACEPPRAGSLGGLPEHFPPQRHIIAVRHRGLLLLGQQAPTQRWRTHEAGRSPAGPPIGATQATTRNRTQRRTAGASREIGPCVTTRTIPTAERPGSGMMGTRPPGSEPHRAFQGCRWPGG